jgi:hypothetical protein
MRGMLAAAAVAAALGATLAVAGPAVAADRGLVSVVSRDGSASAGDSYRPKPGQPSSPKMHVCPTKCSSASAGPEVKILPDSRPEGDPGDTTLFTFRVELSKASKVAVTVDYRTVEAGPVGYRATSGVDFQPKQGTLRFRPGDTIEFVHVDIVPDRVAEADEELRVELLRASGATIAPGTGGKEFGRILDDDRLPLVSILQPGPRLPEGNAGGKRFVFTVRLERKSGRTVTVGYHTETLARAHDHAIAGIDFGPLSGVLTFRPGETEKQIPVTVYGDRKREYNESFLFVLDREAVTNAQVTRVGGSALGVILTDDGEPLEQDTRVYE